MIEAAALALALAAQPGGPAATGFPPGEEMTLAVRFLGLPTGEGKITVGQRSGRLQPVVFQAWTTGVAGFLDIREHLVAYLDLDTGLPTGTDLRAVEMNDRHLDRVRFDRDLNQATVTVQRRSRTREKVIQVPPGTRDLTSTFMWLRLQPLQVGDRYSTPVLAGSKAFPLEAEVLGRETITVPAGTFETLKVRASTSIDGKFSTRRDNLLWFSADERRAIVRLEGEFLVGNVVAELKAYRAGAGLAER
jgi:hypothetical protein